MTGKQDASVSLIAIGRSASGLMQIVSIGVIVFGAGWYMASQEGGGGAVDSLRTDVAVMSAKLTTAMNLAERQQAMREDEQRKLLKEIAELTAKIERLRAESEGDRRSREAMDARTAAETAWLRQQLLDLRASSPGGSRRQSDDGVIEPGEIHPPAQTPQSMPDQREALSPFPPRFIFR